MRANQRTQRKRRSRDTGSFWLSFSDLMSALVLIFVLIMFYSMYQYFDMYEIKEAEIARQQYDLDTANQELAEKEDKLSSQEQEMIAQQIKLNAAEQGLTDTQDILSQQQGLLDEKEQQLTDAQSLIDEKETELAAKQEKLDALSVQLGTQASKIESQQQQLSQQQDQIEQLVGLRTRIIVDLSAALKDANISATVDQATGAIALKSDVLFTTGSAELSEAGKQSVDDFLPVYLNVLLSDEYRSYVSEIIIEGHTDSTGSYITNLELSQRRALSVASYVLSDGYYAIDSAQSTLLRQITTANGRSYSDRILVNGVEDAAASRRVVFKFRLTDEQMISQLQSILENSASADTAPVQPEETPEVPDETAAPGETAIAPDPAAGE